MAVIHIHALSSIACVRTVLQFLPYRLFIHSDEILKSTNTSAQFPGGVGRSLLDYFRYYGRHPAATQWTV